MHKCDIPLCVNPGHLFLGDNAANAADRVAKGRSGTGRAERSGRTILTNAQAIAIINDQRYQKEIAADYGITQGAVSKIKRGATWGSISGGARDIRGRVPGRWTKR